MIIRNAVALVTGGVHGLGRKFSETLLKRGANVIVADIDVDAGKRFEQDFSEEVHENKLVFIKCDVSNRNELAETFLAAKESFGQLDIICNNAGIISGNYELSRKQVDINLTAVIEGTFNGINLMSKRKGGNGGVIVNIASAAGLLPMKFAPVYTASKHAVVAFTRCFSALPHFTEDGVRVNCLCPFFFETDLVRNGLGENPLAMKVIEGIGGFLQIEDVVDGLMKCVETEDMNAKVVVVQPPKKIYEMKFPKANL